VGGGLALWYHLDQQSYSPSGLISNNNNDDTTIYKAL